MPDNDEKNYQLETLDLPGQEIFAAGKWNGDTYSESDLEDMAAAFNETKGVWGVPLKLSHDHPSHLPAVGWVENVRRVGQKLIADFVKIPKTVYELISAGGYRGKSAEIFWNASVNGKAYPFLLKAVALLGIDPKAVQSINDLVALYGAATGTPARAYEGTGESKRYDLGTENDNKEDAMSKELEAKLAEAETKYAEAIKKVEEMGKEIEDVKAKFAEADKRASDAEGKLAEYAQNEINRSVNEVVDKLIADAKLAPAKKDYAVHLLKGLKTTGDRKYKVEDKEYSLEEIAMSLLDGGKVNLPTNEESQVGERRAEDLDQKVKDYMAKHEGLSYRDALRAVAPAGK